MVPFLPRFRGFPLVAAASAHQVVHEKGGKEQYYQHDEYVH
jgi:hypothetical protein